MFGFGPATRIYLAAGATDLRKGFDGLHGLVRDRLQGEPTSGHVFLFANAQRTRLKLLVFDAADCGSARNAWSAVAFAGPPPLLMRSGSRSRTKSWPCCW